MSYKKRAVLYLIRKKGKTAGIFLLVFVVSTFLLSSFAVLNASEKLSADIRSSIGAAFYLRARTESISGENGETTVIQNQIHITDKEIEEIQNLGEIAYYNPVNYGYARSEHLLFIPGEKDNEENNMGQVTSVRYSALTADFMDDTLTLSDGRHIVETDSNAVLISSLLAEINDLSVGDTITLESAELGERDGEYVDTFSGEKTTTEVTVIGIYDILEVDGAQTVTAGRQENMIYASLDVLTNLNEAEPSVYTGEVDFYINDPAELDELISEIQNNLAINWNTHFIRANDFQYSKMSDELQSLGDLVKILLVCVSVVSTVLLSLILTLRTRGRVHEAGILMAVGITKKEIVKQFLFETLSLAVIAFLLSCLLYHGVSAALEHYVLTDFQIELFDLSNLKNAGTEQIRAADYLTLSGGQTFLIFICQIFVIFGAVILSSVSILRMKPREILSKMS